MPQSVDFGFRIRPDVTDFWKIGIFPVFAPINLYSIVSSNNFRQLLLSLHASFEFDIRAWFTSVDFGRERILRMFIAWIDFYSFIG
jgi:hypothetical protein